MTATGTADQVWAHLRPEDRALLTQLAAAAPGARVALVGGAVRDALLGTLSLETLPLDLDIAVEGADVEALAAATRLPYLFHPAYRNATLTLPDGRAADLVAARRETYPVPGQNPVPAPGTLEDDLRRRDFRLNALALVLGDTPALLDVTGGLDDLAARTLRPLHPKSFQEDASRLVRGARLAARLGLHAHLDLLAQVPDALAMAGQTPRLWAELRLLLQEPRPGAAARQLHDWGASDLAPGVKHLEDLDAQRDAGHDVSPTAYAAALLHAAPGVYARLELGDKPAGLLARALSDTPYPAGTPERLLRALLRPDAYEGLSGRDVLALGAAPGPAVGRALAHLAELRRAGRVRSAQDEREALQSYLRRQGP